MFYLRILQSILVIILLVTIYFLLSFYPSTIMGDYEKQKDTENLRVVEKRQKVRKKLSRKIFLNYLRQNSTYSVTYNAGKGS